MAEPVGVKEEVLLDEKWSGADEEKCDQQAERRRGDRSLHYQAVGAVRRSIGDRSQERQDKEAASFENPSGEGKEGRPLPVLAEEGEASGRRAGLEDEVVGRGASPGSAATEAWWRRIRQRARRRGSPWCTKSGPT